MALEQYANNATTTLSGDITSGAVVISVASSGTSPWFFPDSPQYRIRIDDELMLVTGISGLNWTVSRAQENSVAAAHVSGSLVSQILSKEGLRGLSSQTVQKGVYANLPAQPQADGSLYLPTDAAMAFISSGGVWKGMGPLFYLTPPTTGMFPTVVNSAGGTRTFVPVGPGVRLTFVAGVNSGDNGGGVFHAAPATPWTITALFIPHLSSDTFERCGIAMRESGTGELYLFYFDSNNGALDNVGFGATKWNSFTSFNSGVPGSTIPSVSARFMNIMGYPFWFRMGDNGTNVTFEVSFDQQYWYLLGTESRTAFMAGGPDQVGLVVEKFNGTKEVALTCFSWTVSP